MPASYFEAFNPPFSLNNVSREYYEKQKSDYGSNYSDNSSASLRNPGYNNPQSNYKVTMPNYRSISDLETMADKIDQQNYQSSYNSTVPRPKNTGMNMKEFSNHECNVLIAQILACSNCRKKIFNLLKVNPEQEMDNDDTNQSQYSQNGGTRNNRNYSNNFDFSQCVDVKLLTTIVIGILIMYILDMLLR